MAFKDTTWYVNFGDGATTGYYAVPVWPGALTPVTAGTWCRQLTAPAVGSERCFVCIVAGTTGAAEPVWVVTRGADTGADIDGTVTWQECTGMPGPCGDLTNANTWLNYKNTAVTLGASIYDATSGSLQICSTAGTAGNGASPSFSATAGVVTSDGATLKWTSLGPTSNYTTAFKYPHARLANALASTWVAAGNTVYVSNNHAETQSSALTLPSSQGSQASPIKIYGVVDTAAPPVTLSSAPTISTTGANSITLSTVRAYAYGLNFNSGNAGNTANIISGADPSVTFDTCSFTLNNTSVSSVFEPAAGGNIINGGGRYLTCSFIFGATAQGIGGVANAINSGTYLGCTFAGSGSVPTTLFEVGGGANKSASIFLRDCDISNVTGTLFNMLSASDYRLALQNCKLGAAVSPLANNIGTNCSTTAALRMHNCDSTNTNYRYYYSGPVGTIQQETTIVRTGSLATDGTTPISWNVTTTANSSYPASIFTSEEISIWNDTTGSTVIITLYLISNTTLNNNDFWAEVEYAGTSGFPLGLTVNSGMTLLGTPTGLTSDTSTWGGSTNKYKIVLTCTPQNKGPIKVRFYAAKASATTYVDPYIYLS